MEHYGYIKKDVLIAPKEVLIHKARMGGELVSDVDVHRVGMLRRRLLILELSQLRSELHGILP